MTNQPEQPKSDKSLTPVQLAWYDAYSSVEVLWEESRDEHPEFSAEALQEYRAELEKILEYLDEGMQNKDFPDD